MATLADIRCGHLLNLKKISFASVVLHNNVNKTNYTFLENVFQPYCTCSSFAYMGSAS